MLREQSSPDMKEQKREDHLLSFKEYEQFCNLNNPSSRKSGILSDEIYDEAIDDQSTVYANIEGVKVPVLVDMKYGLGLGYDEDRARKYADMKTNVSALAIPIGDLDPIGQEAVIKAVADSPDRAIFYADNDGRDAAALMKGLQYNQIDAVEIPLLDRRCRADNRQASLSLYLADNKLPEYSETSPRIGLDAAQAIFNSEFLPTIENKANAVLLKNGADFATDELEDIWNLYMEKFELLGENHPISMEDTKADFLGTFTSPSTTVSIRYTQDKPVCFTYFTENFDSLYWLNSDYLRELKEDEPNLTTLFFPGIVAGKAGGNHAQEVIQLFAEVSAKAGINHRIVFENTNLSEMYIPRIVHDSVDGVAGYSVDKPVRVDQTHYRLITF